ncbi:ArnT family glycosyltransferase [Candidatus Jordarchaeum sp.]|uniref:ArnT family glycosyltransferase n=1 Tax=Candidatus Jordarchaeum sp. TaxID=2823881 RepID=UPI00404B3254
MKIVNAFSSRKFYFFFAIISLAFWAFATFYGIRKSFAFGYDEGVYLQTASQHANGQNLYKPLFLSQPPLLVEILSIVIRMFGPNVTVTRSVNIFFGIIILVSVFFISKELFNLNTALLALIFLGVNFHFIKWTKELSTNIPSLAFALLTIYATLVFNKKRKHIWIIFSAFAFGIANTFKLLEIFFIFPIIYLLVTAPLKEPRVSRIFRKSKILIRTFSEKSREGKFSKLSSISGGIQWSGWSFAIKNVLLFGGAYFATILIILLNYDLGSLKAQVFGFGSSQLFVISIRRAGRYFGNVYIASQVGLFFLTFAGLATLYFNNRRVFILLIIWIISQLLFHILMSTWLWPHHLIVLIPVFSMVSAFFVNSATMETFPEKRKVPQNRVSAFLLLLPRIIMIILVTVTLFQNIFLNSRYMKKQIRRGYIEEEIFLLETIRQYTEEQDLIVSDVQIANFLTGRFTDPNLVDTSYKRIKTGNLRDSYLIDKSKNMKMVIFWNRKLELLKGYHEFVNQNFKLIYKNQEKEIYLFDQ